jgi:putative spermidine/putrescine transport system substrate-binding protein
MQRRELLKSVVVGAAVLAAPAIVRAQPKELLMAGPGAQAKMFEAELLPLLQQRLGIKITFDASTFKHLEVLTAQKAQPTFSVAWLTDYDMITASERGLLARLTPAAVPGLDKVFPAAIGRDGQWVRFKVGRFSVGVNTDKVQPPLAAWADLWEPRFKGKVMVPGFVMTQGPMLLTMAAHLDGGKPPADAQYDTEAGLRKLKALKPSVLSTFSASPQALLLLEQGEAHAVVGLFTSMLNPRRKAGLPVDLTVPREGSFANPDCIARIAGGPHPELADALIEAMLSPEIQTLLMQKTADSPMRRDVAPADGVVAADRMITLDAEYWNRARPQILDRYAAALA